MPHEHPTADFEEKFSFMERDIDHLREQVADIWKRLDTAQRRVDRLAKAFQDAEGPTAGDAEM